MGFISSSNILQIITIQFFWQTIVVLGNETVFSPDLEEDQEVSTDFQCVNNKDWLFSDDPSMPCAAIQRDEETRVELCQIMEVYDNCPVSCGKCCENDTNYRIQTLAAIGNSKFQSCEWLGTNVRSNPEWWCDTRNNGRFVRDACPKSCGRCQLHVSPNPTSKLSDQPSNHFSTWPSTSSSPISSPISSSTKNPSKQFSRSPSIEPPIGFNNNSTKFQTNLPTLTTTTQPSTRKTSSPTLPPTMSQSPTLTQSVSPSKNPSSVPSTLPSNASSSRPTLNPSSVPSSLPTNAPTSRPTPLPTSGPTPSPTETRPNLVMILTDEHNLRTLSCYRDYLASKVGAKSTDVWGNLRLDTPNIDKLASQGALFSNFYTVAPLCTPSRASFMTGMYPSFTGESIKNNGAMDENMTTFAKVLKDEKLYRTAYFGKWHLDGDVTPGWGSNERQFGFDENKYRFNRGHFKWIDEVNGNMAGYAIEDEWKFEGKQSENFTTDYLVDRGIEFMKSSIEKNEPFAMVLSIPDPHGPNHNRQPYRDMYKHLHFKVPETARTARSYNPATPGYIYIDTDENSIKDADQSIENYENGSFWQRYMQQYYGMVKCIDHNVGKLMKAIEDLDIDDDTIIVFTSDHGDLLMEHARLNKGQPYETSAGIPFLIRYPGKVQAGKVVETAYSSVDFAPTILSLMGVSDTDVNFQGVDGTEELLNSDIVSYDEEKIIFSMDTGKNPIWAMAQMGHTKLVISRDVPWLFDLLLDPDEIRNFIDSYKHVDIKQKLQDAITEALFEYKIPLTWFRNSIYIDKPVCSDKRDILPLTSGQIATCKDIGGSVKLKRCEKQFKIRNHCPQSCLSCCEDTVGTMLVEAKVYGSCRELEGLCEYGSVRTFCPMTCKTC